MEKNAKFLKSGIEVQKYVYSEKLKSPELSPVARLSKGAEYKSGGL